MVAGKHAVALLTNFSQALSVSGGKIHFLGFPAGQKGKGFLAAGQINQRNAAELLQKFQLAVHAAGSGLPGAAAGSFADADVLILQNGVQQHAGPTAAAFKQLVFKISCSAYKILAPRSGQHGAERRHNVGLQNTAENHKAVQPGAHGIQLHHSQFLQECKNACSVYSV